MLSVKLHSAHEEIKEMHDVKTTIVVGCAKNSLARRAALLYTPTGPFAASVS